MLGENQDGQDTLLPELYAVAFTVWAVALGLALQGLRRDKREAERAEQERELIAA